MTSAALVLRFDRARTGGEIGESSCWGWRRLTVEIGVTDVHVVDALGRETRCDLLALLFDIEDQRQKTFDCGGVDIIAVSALDEWLALEVEDGNETSDHGGKMQTCTLLPIS